MDEGVYSKKWARENREEFLASDQEIFEGPPIHRIAKIEKDGEGYRVLTADDQHSALTQVKSGLEKEQAIEIAQKWAQEGRL